MIETYKVIDFESPISDVLDYNDIDSQEIVNDIVQELQSASDIFEERHQKAIRNIDFYKGNQWNDDELDSFRRQMRIPYVFNEIQDKIQHFVGAQVEARLDVKAVPREQGDDMAASLYTALLKWADQTNDIEDIEKEVFLDALLGGVGITANTWEMEDILYGIPTIQKIPFNECFWDPQSQKRDLKDARWFARIKTVPKQTAVEWFPNHAETIKDCPSTNTYNAIGCIFTPNTIQEKLSWAQSTGNKWLNQSVVIIEWYDRYKGYKYIVADDITGDKIEFDTIEEGKAYYQGLVEGYSEQGTILVNEDGTASVAFMTIEVDKIRQTIICGTQVLERNTIALPDFPYTLCFGFFLDGDYWGFVDVLIDPQRFLNRSLSLWDHIIGTSNKGLRTVIESGLARGWDAEKVRKEASKVGPLIPVLRHDAIVTQPNASVNPELFSNISYAQNRITDYAGGRNQLGFQENAAESAKAVALRSQQGGVSRLPLFDNLKKWRLLTELKQVWYIKNIMPTQQMTAIIGTDPDLAPVTLNDGVIDSLNEIKVNITIEESFKAESMRERYTNLLQNMLPILQALPPQVAARMFIEFSGLPDTRKEEMFQMIDQSMKANQQMMEENKQQRLQQSVQDSIKKANLKDQLTRQEELDSAQQEADKKHKELTKTTEEINNMQAKIQ
jgi:hypothetical protein